MQDKPEQTLDVDDSDSLKSLALSVFKVAQAHLPKDMSRTEYAPGGLRDLAAEIDLDILDTVRVCLCAAASKEGVSAEYRESLCAKTLVTYGALLWEEDCKARN